MCVLGKGCAHLASASELNLGQLAARGGASRGHVLPIPPFDHKSKGYTPISPFPSFFPAPCLLHVKVHMRLLWVRPIEWLILNFTSCVIRRARLFYISFMSVCFAVFAILRVSSIISSEPYQVPGMYYWPRLKVLLIFGPRTTACTGTVYFLICIIRCVCCLLLQSDVGRFFLVSFCATLPGTSRRGTCR